MARRIGIGLGMLFAYSLFVLKGQTLPAGTKMQIRLRESVSSFRTKPGAEIRAIVIAPVLAEGSILIPLGTEILGTVIDVRRVGLGFARESAYVHVVFDTLRFAPGQQAPINAKVIDLDNSRETIDAEGRIKGIRATASLSSTISGLAYTAAALDPMLLAFGLSSSLSIFRIPESEITAPTGSELHIELTQPLTLTAKFAPAVPGLGNSDTQAVAFNALIRDLPFRTTTQGNNLPSDLTNLAFLGTEQAVRAAFDAAGWSVTNIRDARSSYGAMRSIVENQGYKEAPMSTLLLNGQEPRVTYSKTLNTFFQRHHLRVFAQTATFENQQLWTSSSTHDSGIGFAINQKSFIHLIDENIDEEREKVVNDLILTGCVTGLELVPRPWVPLDASNSTGDRLRTDGRIAVVRLNDCANPKRAGQSYRTDATQSSAPNAMQKATRNTFLTLRNDVIRGNIAYQGYQGINMATRVMRGRKSNTPTAAPKSVEFGGQSWQIVRGAQSLPKGPNLPKDPSHQLKLHDPAPTSFETFLEFSISAGYSRFANERFSTQPLDLTLNLGTGSNLVYRALGETELRPGFSLAGNATFNAHKHFSHELGFTYNQSKLNIDLVFPGIVTESIKGAAAIRQFHYALLMHARPNGKRLRPYLALGAGMQMIRQTDSAEKGNPYLKFTFKELNILYNAFRFGGDPPLEGGGIFQPTLHYGGGVKYHATRRIVLRADYRETLSRQPDFWTKSHQSLRDAVDEIEPLPVLRYGPLRQQRATIGIGITF